MDYRVINSLLPEVQKAHSKAKGVLTLVPLPQIDHIYARLRGSQIFSTFDLRSGYHHMELSPEARAKSAFVTPLDKFEFTRCPFGLSQAPAYFQRLMNQVIKGLPLAFVYVVRRRGRLAPRQPLSVCALLPAYEGNRHLWPLGNLGHHLRRPRWID